MECTEWQTIGIRSEVLAHLQTRNRRHFGQARNTPFTSPPLCNDFGYCTNTLEVQALMEGQYVNEQMIDTPAVCLLLDHMHHIHTLADQQSTSTISEDEFRSK
jgi:hypothetical protein